MTKRIVWRKGRVFSLRLRNGYFALLQMLARPRTVAVFNCFRKADVWGDVHLDRKDVLFCTLLLKSVLKRSEIAFHANVSAVQDLEWPVNPRIHIGDGWRNVTLWEGTPEERTFLMMGEGNNSLREISRDAGVIREEYHPIPIHEYNNYANVELTNLSDYPTFNERLYLCWLLKRNVDPLKELAFKRQLGPEFQTYVDIMSGNVKLSELGY